MRSSHGHFVKANGLRWLRLMLLVPIPWAYRVWAKLVKVPTAQRLECQRGFAVSDGAGPLEALLPNAQTTVQDGIRLGTAARVAGELVVVADSGFAALEFLAATSRHSVTCITRLGLDAALYDPAPPRLPGTVGRPRTKGKRLATLYAMLADPATA